MRRRVDCLNNLPVLQIEALEIHEQLTHTFGELHYSSIRRFNGAVKLCAFVFLCKIPE